MAVQHYVEVDHHGNIRYRLSLGGHHREFSLSRRCLEMNGEIVLDRHIDANLSMLYRDAARDKARAE